MFVYYWLNYLGWPLIGNTLVLGYLSPFEYKPLNSRGVAADIIYALAKKRGAACSKLNSSKCRIDQVLYTYLKYSFKIFAIKKYWLKCKLTRK